MQKELPHTIFLTSNEPWGDVWFSKQHYANELAKMGHQVYFLNAPTGWSPKNLFRINLRVEKTDPWVKGDTASGDSKPATLETGYVLNVPPFIEEGQLLKIDTRSGQYVERVKE